MAGLKSQVQNQVQNQVQLLKGQHYHKQFCLHLYDHQLCDLHVGFLHGGLFNYCLNLF